MLFLFYAFILLISSVGILIWRKIEWLKMYGKLHRNMGLPIVGNAFLLTCGDEGRMTALSKFSRIALQQGGLTSLWLGPRFFIMVADAKVADVVMKTCLGKDDIMTIAHELFGNGSIFAPLQIWRPRRKVIAPTFSMKNLNQFVNVFSQQSKTMVVQLKNAAGKGSFSIWKYLTTYTMDSVCETALGVKVDAQRNPDQPFLEAFDQHCQMSSARIVQPPIAQQAYKYFPIYKLYMKHIYCMWDFVDSIIRKKRNEIAEKEEKQIKSNSNGIKEKNIQKTFLELFIESSGGSSGFTDLELREETLVLLLAGTDTSAVGTAFACLMLARHPDVQEKVYEEVQEVLGDSDGNITAEDLPRLKYLDAVIKETLRLYPPVPVIVRKADKDLQLPSGLTIVKDTALMISIWAIHRNPTYWGEDAEEFRPDRFIGAGPSHPEAFIPFSHGPRSCLGYQYAMMSMKTAMANLIRNYRLLPASPVGNNNKPLRVKYDIMMKHVDNFELLVESRTP